MSDQPSLASNSHAQVIEAIKAHRLPSNFLTTVEQFYWPLAQSLKQNINKTKPTLIGVQGSQGSGKSTCASFLKLLLESEYQLNVLVASIDDFYLTRAARQQLAKECHPLFITRGVPATHDVNMMNAMFNHVVTGEPFSTASPLQVPVFDKSVDDRASQTHWQKIENAVDVVILEGWCVGISAQDSAALTTPINELERVEDSNGVWRGAVNRALGNEYNDLFARLDILVTLQAPSFKCVLGWRQLQEEKMIAKLKSEGKSMEKAQTKEQIKRFISHYQRLTEHALATMPEQADYVLWLDENHQFTKLETVQK